MRLEKNRQDQMTPAERITSAGEGKMVDRVITIPFMGELKCYLSGISIRDFWFDAEKIAQAERIAFNRWGYDRIVLGPNTRGIVEALGGTFIYPKDGIPYIESPYITDYGILDRMEPVNVNTGVCAGGRYTEQRSRKSCAIRSKYRRTVYDCFES